MQAHQRPRAEQHAELIDAFKQAATARISDNPERLLSALGLWRFHCGAVMAGTALTVKAAASDNLFVSLSVKRSTCASCDEGRDLDRAAWSGRARRQHTFAESPFGRSVRVKTVDRATGDHGRSILSD